MTRSAILLSIAATLALLACRGGGSGAAAQSFQDGSPEAAFVSLHKAYRAADADTVWALSSDETREAMARRIHSLRQMPDRLKKELGKTPEQIADLDDKSLYTLLLQGRAMQAKLRSKFPRVTATRELEPGLVEIAFEGRRGRCTQPFIKLNGTWLMRRSAVCAR